MTRPQALLAVSLAFVATAVYAVMWVGHSQDWGWLHSFDWSLLNAAHDIGIKNPAWVRFWDGVSLILGPVVLRPLGLLAAMVALAKRKIRIALLLLACLPLNAIMTIAAKSVATARDRRLRWYLPIRLRFRQGMRWRRPQAYSRC